MPERSKSMRTLFATFISLLIAGSMVFRETIEPTLRGQRKGCLMNNQSEPNQPKRLKKLTIKVVYDNNPYAAELGTDWGFSAFVSGAEKTILFDTGGKSRLLLSNMRKLAIEPNSVDVVVLSHIHGDHTGGLPDFLQINPHVTVYVPESFPKKFKQGVREYGARLVEVKEPVKMCANIYSTGQLGRLIKEQSLIIRTQNGLIVMTGCAHPGIVKIVDAARSTVSDDILFVMGGFHLEWATAGKIEKIISTLKGWNVEYAGPCHCSGHKARTLFEKSFGKKYVNVGVGKTITLADLQ